MCVYQEVFRRYEKKYLLKEQTYRLLAERLQDRFVPEGHLTRAQMAMLLYRMAGTPGVQGENPFTDVRTGKWYTNAVLWAAEHEIVYGYGDGRFRPDGDITRQEAVTMLARFAALQEVELKKTVARKMKMYPRFILRGSCPEGRSRGAREQYRAPASSCL